MAGELPEGTVTVLFTDVEGSTELTSRRGDEAAQEILRAQRELVRQQVARHSGHEVKSLGDGFMVAFASARRAVACAVAIQRALGQGGGALDVGEEDGDGAPRPSGGPGRGHRPEPMAGSPRWWSVGFSLLCAGWG